jgi:hypothetical protein
MEFAVCVPVESLVASTSLEDAVSTDAVDHSVGLIERPVQREEADRGVHALDGIPKIFTVLAEVVISVIYLSPQ